MIKFSFRKRRKEVLQAAIFIIITIQIILFYMCLIEYLKLSIYFIINLESNLTPQNDLTKIVDRDFKNNLRDFINQQCDMYGEELTSKFMIHICVSLGQGVSVISVSNRDSRLSLTRLNRSVYIDVGDGCWRCLGDNF